MTSEYRRMGLVFALAVGARLLFYTLTGFTYDDAFITFRYAENLAQGLGFVYNPGHQVLGTTSPLFTLILSMFVLGGITPVVAALLISLVCSGLTAVLVYSLARALGLGHFAPLPALLFVLFPRLLTTDTGGMETALFTLLVTAAFYYHYRRLPWTAVGAASLACLTRPEGLLALGLVLASAVRMGRRQWFALLSIPALTIIPWVVFAWLYFGSPVPNSITAKLALYSRFGTQPAWESLVLLMGWHSLFGIALTVAALIGGWWLIRQRAFGTLEIAWLLMMVLGLTMSSTHLFLWYIAPIYPFYLLFAGAAAPALAARWRWLSRNERSFAAIAVAAACVALVTFSYRAVDYYRDYQRQLESEHKAIGIYLSSAAAPSDVVAAEDIGYLGYYSGLRIVDRDGLVSPEVVPYNARGEYLKMILAVEPDWVVACAGGATSGFIDSSRFRSAYTLDRVFRHDDGPGFQVYARIPSGASDSIGRRTN